MHNVLDRLVALDRKEKERLGVVHTPCEIREQTSLWIDTVDRVLEKLRDIEEHLIAKRTSPENVSLRSVVLSGAGSSDHVGRSIELLLRRRLGVHVDARPTTDLVVNSPGVLLAENPYLVVLFARSGDSPESIGTFEVVRKVCRDVKFLAVTCNADGNLARLSDELPGEVVKVVLDPRTNDKGLAMTGSFTNMMVAGQSLAFLDDLSRFRAMVGRMCRAGEYIMVRLSDVIHEVASEPFERAVFLGSGVLTGVAREAALKLQELTDGRIVTMSQSFLGLRHGPEAVINERTLIVYFVSQDPYRLKYEMDLIREVNEKAIGLRKLAVSAKVPHGLAGLVDECIEFDPQGELNIPDDLRPPVDVIVGQLLGLFKSLNLGLKPDSPSVRGVINRVVQGVRCYPLESGCQDQTVD